MKTKLQNKIALLSLLITPDVEQNLSRVIESAEKCHAEGCKLIVFPECALTGGLPTEQYDADIKVAVEIPGKMTATIGTIAKNNDLYIAIGLLEREHGSLYDTALLFSNRGEIVLKYRRMNPQWHSRSAPKHLYIEGSTFATTSTPFGEIGFTICGDMFDDRVIAMIKKVGPRYLIIPMDRCFDNQTYDQKRWEKEEKWTYTRQIAKIGIISFLVNSFEPKEEGASFGGSLVVSSTGEILKETRIGQPSILFYELPEVS